MWESESTQPQDEYHSVSTLWSYQEDKCFPRVVSEREFLRLTNHSQENEEELLSSWEMSEYLCWHVPGWIHLTLLALCASVSSALYGTGAIHSLCAEHDLCYLYHLVPDS